MIYYLSNDGGKKLCIPQRLYKAIFNQAHDENNHAGFHRSYEAVSGSLYLRKLSGSLKKYIEHCPLCQRNQTKRHMPYGALRPITSPLVPYYTISMDFIVELPATSYETGAFDVCLTMTCKFSKKVLLKEGRTTWDAARWGVVVITALIAYDWGIPRAIISDRDLKFMSGFWKGVFQKLNTKLLTSTAYHPQTDGQAERTNQVVEIALRYFLSVYPTENWNAILPFIQGNLNNSSSAATGIAPNKITGGFRVANSLGHLFDSPLKDYAQLRDIKHNEADEAIAFANASAKARYNGKHKPLELATGEKVFLRLHKGYTIPSLANQKLSLQRVGPFIIKRKIGELAYELDLPPTMAIHPVISIAQLEPAPKGSDPFQREYSWDPPPVKSEGDSAPYYEIERLIGKQVSRKKTQYLVTWKGYDDSHNVWYNEDDLGNAKEAIQDYEAFLASRPGPRRKVKEILGPDESLSRKGGREAEPGNKPGGTEEVADKEIQPVPSSQKRGSKPKPTSQAKNKGEKQKKEEPEKKKKSQALTDRPRR